MGSSTHFCLGFALTVTVNVFASDKGIDTYRVSVHHVKSEHFNADYGTIFEDYDAEPVTVEKWPRSGWREIEDGVGGGTTEGSFMLAWEADGSHKAFNSGVADGAYQFAWDSATEAVAASSIRDGYVQHDSSSTDINDLDIFQGANTTSIFAFEEINYHACGSQCFYSEKDPIFLLLATLPQERWPDDIIPTDFKCFYVPPGLGVNVAPFVWHSPPIAVPGYSSDSCDESSCSSNGNCADNQKVACTVMKTKQAKVHSKIYYDPVKEHGTLLEIVYDQKSLDLVR
jgi:ureidoglycolate hydrolase